MQMNKIAIFVEGDTELIFVREMLLTCLGYQYTWVDCYAIQGKSTFKVDYEYKPEVALLHN